MNHQEFVQSHIQEERLDDILGDLENLQYSKKFLKYSMLLLEIENSLIFDERKMFDCIIKNPIKGAASLNQLKDVLVYVRDNNEELKVMYAEDSPISAPILFYLLSITLKVYRTVEYLIKTCKSECYQNNASCNEYIYPYLCSLRDVVEVIAYRHLKLFLYKYKFNPDMENYLANIPKQDLHCISRKGCVTKDFNIALQGKLGVDLKLSHLLKPDENECAVCGVSLDAYSDFAVLDTCNHLMCTDCAEVTLMGEVIDMIPLYMETDDDDDDHAHLIELGKIPKCPCCRREVGQWTTTNIMKYRAVYENDFWDVNNKSLLPQESLSFIDISRNCINECLLIKYILSFVWMAICKHVKILEEESSFRRNEFLFVLRSIVKLLELIKAGEWIPEHDEPCTEFRAMFDIEIIINRLISSDKIENNASIQRLLTDIRSNF